MKAVLSNFRQSPRKVRLVADSIRGKNVDRARRVLQFDTHKSSSALLKLLDSALSNARQSGKSADNLFVKDIMVDLSMMLKRGMPMARGRSSIIRHRYSRVTLALGEHTKESSKTAEDKPATKKAVKKVAEKKTVAKKAVKKTATK